MGAPNKLQILAVRRASPPSNGGDSTSNSTFPPSDDSIDKEQQQIKKPRASKPRVRTGCLTCKIRRVKCDEIKPSCNRCTSTGRKCDGYYIPPRKNRRIDLDAPIELPRTPERCLEVVPGTPQELRAVEYFHAQTAPKLSSYFDAGFWTRLVCQVSHNEPSVMHAMVCVGYLNRRRDFKMQPLPMPRSVVIDSDPGTVSKHTTPPVKHYGADHNDPFALAQYNKAISLLAQRLRDPDAAVEVALLTCILFVCIEFLRGDVEPASRHFKSGMGIALDSLAKPDSTKAALTKQRIKEGILPFFNRMELLSMLFGQEASYEYPISINEAVPTKFTSIREARDSVVHLMNYALRFIRRMKKGRYERLILPDDFARQATIQRAIESWKEALDSLLLTDTVSARDLDAAKVLRVHQIVMVIWLGTCCDIADSALDAYMEDFEAAVSLGEAIQRNAGTFEQRRAYQPTFLFDMELVSPLYYVGIKCRHPQIRRRVIALLRQTMRREGLWDSNMAAAIVERIAALEEVNLSTLDGSELPAERDRVHNTEIHSMADSQPYKHMLRYYSKPDGLDAEWKIWTEHLLLETDHMSRPDLLY